jgi:acyl carrier protein
VRGVIHAAALVQDSVIRNLTEEKIEQVFAPKLRGASNLDELTRDMRLDFFVLYSSATTLFGNPGQAAYVAANRYLEVLAEERRAQGLPALCMAWGPIADAGYLARHPEIRKALEGRMRAISLPVDYALSILEQSILANATGVACVSFERHGMPRVLAGTRSPKFKPLAARFDQSAAAAGDETLARWLAEHGDEKVAELIAGLVQQEIATILRMAPDMVDIKKPLPDLGLDSLMGVELMTALEVRFGVSLPVMAMSEASTVERLAKRLVAELRRGASAEEPAEDSLPETVQMIAAQHAAEVDEQTVNKFVADFKVTAK